MKRRVLLVSRDFAPSLAPSAQSATKLAKYLVRAGFEVTVLTGEANGGRDALLKADLAAGCGRVLRASTLPAFSFLSRLFARPLRSRKSDSSLPRLACEDVRELPEGNSFVNAARGWFFSHRIKKQERSFYRAALAYVSHAGLDLSHYDVMISAYSPMSSHMVALALKAKCPTIRWIADFRRTPPRAYPAPLCRYYRRCQKRLLLHCDTLTASSTALIKELLPRGRRVRTAVIPNGFDPEDLMRIPVADADEKRPFTICLTPSDESLRADFSPLFSAVSDLIKTGRVRRDQIVFEYYGSHKRGEELAKQISEMELPPLFYDRGKASRMEVLSAERSAQLLVCPAFDRRAERGEIPEKFMEALMLQKPVIALLYGDVTGGEFSRMMRALRVGVLWEEEDGEESYEFLKKYIAESYTYWRTMSRDLYEPDEKRYRAHSYDNLIRQWAEVIFDF